MIKATVEDIVRLIAGGHLDKIGEQSCDDPAVQWFLAELIDFVPRAYQRYGEIRDTLIMRYGTGEDNGAYSIPSEKRDEFLARMAALHRHEINVPVEPVDHTALARTGLSAATIAALRPFTDAESVSDPSEILADFEI